MRRITTGSCILSMLLLLAGCRAYGGSGAEEAMYARIQSSLERFDNDLSRMRGELSALEAASSEHPDLTPLAAQYRALLQAHEATLDQHREMVESVSPSSGYRDLHHVYGAMIVRQQSLRQQSQGLLRHVYEGYSADSTMAADHGRPYVSVPPYYRRVTDNARELTANQVIARIRSGATPRDDFRQTMPETSSADTLEEEAPEGGH